MFRQEIAIFLSALMFYTRLPVPSFPDFKEEYLNKATRYFPLVGWIVAALIVGTYLFSAYLFSAEISIILCLVVGVLATGAFHEDGFADVCDGFGGGWSKEKILEIMKDSRVGTFAVVGLLLLFLLKFFALLQLHQKSIFVESVLFSQVMSRWFALTFVATTPYSRTDAQSKIKPIAKKLALKDFIIASIIAFVAFYLFPYWQIIGIFLVLIPLKIYLRYFFMKWIEGYTGDCLGASQQIAEMGVYLYLVATIK
ncbi:MAG: adenosylcobinamide-GDP ribazoletransferase [Raineya sp.]